jgi:hypothetical protein
MASRTGGLRRSRTQVGLAVGATLILGLTGCNAGPALKGAVGGAGRGAIKDIPGRELPHSFGGSSGERPLGHLPPIAHPDVGPSLDTGSSGSGRSSSRFKPLRPLSGAGAGGGVGACVVAACRSQNQGP